MFFLSYICSKDNSCVELERRLILLVDLLLSLRANFTFGLSNKTQTEEWATEQLKHDQVFYEQLLGKTTTIINVHSILFKETLLRYQQGQSLFCSIIWVDEFSNMFTTITAITFSMIFRNCNHF